MLINCKIEFGKLGNPPLSSGIKLGGGQGIGHRVVIRVQSENVTT